MCVTISKQELIDYIEDGLNDNPRFFIFVNKPNNPYKEKLIELTSFLSESSTNPERYHCLVNGISTVPSCTSCNTPVTFNRTIRAYRKYCSLKCSNSSKEVQDKKKSTMMKNYGVENPMQAKEVQDKVKATNLERHGVEHTFQSELVKVKMKATCLERYGVENPLQSKEVQDKVKATNIERHGVEHAAQSKEVQDKMKATMIERHGVENAMQSHLIRDKVKATNLERYGVENPLQSKEIRDKTKVTMIERHGVEHALQSEVFRVKAKDKTKVTNLEKYGVEFHTQKHLSQDTLDKLNNPHWLMTKHHKEKLSLTDISGLLGVKPTTISRYFRKLHIKVNTPLISAQERELQDFIKSLLPDTKILFNDRNILKPKELDIYVPSMNLAIEYNGLYWHSDKFKDNDYHLKKLESCLSKGITLIQIFEDEWIYNTSLIKKKLTHLLNQDTTKSVYARKCVVKDVPNKDYNTFLETNHVQGTINASIRYGL